MPLLSGFDLYEKLKHKCNIIFISAYPDLLLDTFDKNVVGVLRKPFSQENFHEMVKKAAYEISFKASQLLQNIVNRKYDLLSIAEKNILLEISKGKAPKQIAADNFLSEKTINTHKENIKKKLCLTTSHDLTIFANDWLKANSK